MVSSARKPVIVQSHAVISCRSSTLHSIYTVNTRTTAIASSGRHLCNRDTCPDCSHLSIAAVRLMESVRERLVASWNKAVASAVSTSQHPKQSMTLISMPVKREEEREVEAQEGHDGEEEMTTQEKMR